MAKDNICIGNGTRSYCYLKLEMRRELE